MNAQRCESPTCRGSGTLPDHYERSCGQARPNVRTNRKRIDPHYAQRIGEPELAGLLVCVECRARIMWAVNRSFD